MSISPVIFIFSAYLTSYPLLLFLSISPGTFIFSTYLSSFSVSFLLPISPVTFIFSSILFFSFLEPTSLFGCRGYNDIALSHCLWVCESFIFFSPVLLFWSLQVSLTVEVTMTLHLVIASGFVNRQRLHWHSTKLMPLGFWIIAGCNDIAFVHCNCDWKKQRLQWHCT